MNTALVTTREVSMCCT